MQSYSVLLLLNVRSKLENSSFGLYVCIYRVGSFGKSPRMHESGYSMITSSITVLDLIHKMNLEARRRIQS